MLYLLVLRLSATANVYSAIRRCYTPYIVVCIGIKETQPPVMQLSHTRWTLESPGLTS